MTHPLDIEDRAPPTDDSDLDDGREAQSGNRPAFVDVTIPPELGTERLDKALSVVVGARRGLTRTRIAQLISEGAISDDTGRTVAEGRRRVKPGERYLIAVPPPAPAEPEPEPIPLAILYEDAHLIVVDKPAGMVVHPAPGAERGTLVNALLAHCGPGLTGIGGERRPGIVHRLDKDTSGVLVAAKSAEAHEGLAGQFAKHSVGRRYIALMRGAPSASDPRLAGLDATGFEEGGWVRVDAPLGRHPVDRKRMAVRPGSGRRAVTRFRAVERFGAPDGRGPAVTLVECRLETGRTHQIRVHAAHIGHALIGDPIYARTPPPRVPGAEAALAAFPRQALHAAELAFVHPVDGTLLGFEAPPPEDLSQLLGTLRRRNGIIR